MSSQHDSSRSALRATVQAAVSDALNEIGKAIAEGRHIGPEYDWYNLSWSRNNGMPCLSKSWSTGPPCYSNAMSPTLNITGVKPKPDPSDAWQSFDAVEELLFSDPFLRDRLLGPTPDDKNTPLNFSKFTARYLPKRIASRYVSTHNTTAFEPGRFSLVYDRIETAIFADTLPFDLWVPILFLNFTFDDLRIDERAHIARMDEEFHLARASIRSYGSGGHEQVAQCATHALVLEGWSVKNQCHNTLQQILYSPDSYQTDHIERFFGALRAITGLDTGYSQLLVNPHGWELQAKAHLPPLLGTSVRAYPAFFDNFYWNREEVPTLNVDQASTCGLAFTRLANAKENSLALAIRRLNRCYCRDDDDDVLIDATIALEALLSDDQPQEITHKLALRVAAISQLLPDQTKSAKQVFAEIKAVYKHRSKVVHGRAPKDKDRVVAASTQDHIATTEIAREHLRSVIRVLIDHAELRSGDKVDQLILSRVTPLKAQDDQA